MSSSEDLSFDAADFSGAARLFPLPNLVVFPNVMQPLHIFEPRYRAMLEEAIASDGLLGMVLLAPGWETDYNGRPPLRPVGCLCRVATYRRTDEGSYNVLVLGLKRFRLEKELPPDKPFRVAEVTLLDDETVAESPAAEAALQQRLLEAFRRVLPQIPEAYEQLEQLLAKQVPFGMLTDIVAYTLDIDLDLKERLLAEPRVDRRAQMLLEHLAKLRAAIFPPAFSLN